MHRPRSPRPTGTTSKGLPAAFAARARRQCRAWSGQLHCLVPGLIQLDPKSPTSLMVSEGSSHVPHSRHA